MGNVGLLLVGAVLFVNGLASLGVVRGRSVAPLNFFVGGAQVVLPLLVLVQGSSDPAVVQGTWPSLLFGFTYLWYGLIVQRGLETEGFGWYSVFVAGIAALYAVQSVGTDPVFAVIWATWSSMWLLFFVLLALGRSHVGTLDLGRFTGWYLVLLGIPTCTVPALLLMDGRWSTSPTAGWGALAVLAAAAVASVALARRPQTAPAADDAVGLASDDELGQRVVATA
ncbi:AmiS/UreI family transporter [Cellulomonas carbonis]|uniref:Transporter n=1 Tax=Cellulomonas carbonis T26 TaxID=947969 RepID=A0A0A0BU96_9CELL|nr:AmiS/UreI family transporter [Cellulomonas carbonis]KGM11555.1 transporter [Cellulomonas carbonis T26]GGC06623.1 transporter [Cellulomonas carbonis]